MRYISILLVIFNALTIYGQTDSVMHRSLKEVEVLANRRFIKTKGAETKIQIANGPYAEIGSVKEMLCNLPGVVSVNEEIEVRGSGTPAFVVDGREIKNLSELDVLQSSQVREVRIDRNPDMKFSSAYKAVVYIETKKSLDDMLYLQVYNSFGLRHHIQENPGLTMSGQFSKFTTSLSYSFRHAAFRTDETYFRNITPSSDFPLAFTLEQPRQSEYTTNAHVLNWSGEYTFDKYHRLGIYYHTIFEPTLTTETGHNVINWHEEKNSMLFEESNQKRTNLQSLTLYYNYQHGKNRIKFVQDYAYRHSSNELNSREQDGSNNNSIASNASRNYHILTSNIEYTGKLPLDILLTAGERYYYVNSQTNTTSIGGTNYEIPNSAYLHVIEHTPQTYMGLLRRFGSFSASAGFRYEYISRKLSGITDASLHYSKFMPWMRLSYSNDKGFDLYARYINWRRQPSFSQINSGITYQDPYAYSAGNPSLKTSFTHSVRLGGSYKSIDFEVNYQYERNVMDDVEIAVDRNTPVVKQLTVNLPKFQELSFSLGYNLTLIKKMDFYVNCTLSLPDATVRIMDENVKRSSPAFDINANLTYRPLKYLSIYSTFSHQGHRQYITTIQRSVQQWNAGATASLAKGKLSMTLEVTDILNRAHFNNITSNYFNVEYGTFGKNDNRGIRFRVSYTIFNKRIRSNSNRGNEEVINRTE